MSEPFIAQIMIFAGNFAPRNWAFCNGQTMNISQNTALFSLIGTTFGGNGRTTMGVPNLQGRAPMHAGRGPGLAERKLGDHGGVDDVTLVLSQIPCHQHDFQGSTDPPDSRNPGNSLAAQPAGRGGSVLYGTDNPVGMAAAAVLHAGGGEPHTNMQPLLTLNFVICTAGTYPSRS